MEIIRKQYAGLSDCLEIEILSNDNLADRVESEVLKAGGPDVSGNKIPRIKALREVARGIRGQDYVMGLADGKYAIENWDRFIAFIRLHGQLPSDGFSGRGL